MDEEVERVCRLADAMIEHDAEVRNFFPQGKPIISDRPGLIVVHPFYNGFEGKSYVQHNQLGGGRYLANMRLLISHSDRNLFLFEELGKCKRTLSFLAECRSLDGVYLIKASGNPDEHGALPVSAGFNPWKTIADRILDVSERNEFEFAGGELYGDIRDSIQKLQGCLGGAVAKLNDYGIKGRFKEGCCFNSIDRVTGD